MVQNAADWSSLGIAHGKRRVGAAACGLVDGGGGGGAVEQGEDGVIVEGEGRVPVKAEAAAGLRASAGGEGGIGDVDGLVVVVYGGDGVAAGVGGEDELLVVVAG